MPPRSSKLATLAEDFIDVQVMLKMEFALPHSDAIYAAQAAMNTEQMMADTTTAFRRGTWVDTGMAPTFIHYEFEFPHYSAPVKVDVVSRPSVAKIFFENEICTSLYTFDEDNQAWLTVTVPYTFQLTEDSAYEFFEKGFCVKVWDTRDKVSSRARFDRPPLPNQPPLKKANAHLELQMGVDSTRNSVFPLMLTPRNSVSASVRSDSPDLAAERIQSRQASQAVDIRTLGIIASKTDNAGVRVEVVTHPFYIDQTSVMSHFKNDGPSALQQLKQIKVTLSTKTPLLPPWLKRRLNAMVFTVEAVENLPSQPLSFQQLTKLCQPLWGSLSFPPFPAMKFTSKLRNRGTADELEVTFVALTGRYDTDHLLHVLSTQKLHVEVHDRSRIQVEANAGCHLFGEDENDTQKIIAPAKSSKTNAFKQTWTPWDPFAHCELDLSDLAKGMKSVTINAPLLPTSELPPRDGLQIEEDQTPPTAAGRYVEFGTNITVTVAFTYGLVEKYKSNTNDVVSGNSFGRIVCVNKGRHFNNFVENLILLVAQINASALGLKDVPAYQINQALATYEMTSDQRSSTQLDIVTGFVYCDKNMSIAVLEGLPNQGLQRLCNELLFVEKEVNRRFSLLLNSSITFESRNYESFGPQLFTLSFEFSLKAALRDTSLYLHDQVGWHALPCLTQLMDLSSCASLRQISDFCLFPAASDLEQLEAHVARHSLTESFPRLARDTALMARISSARSYLSTPLSRSTSAKSRPHLSSGKQLKSPVTTESHPQIDSWNQLYIELKNSPAKSVNHVQFNKSQVQQISEENARRSPEKYFMIDADSSTAVFPYSSQTLNSTELARTALQKSLRETKPEPGMTSLYTHSNQFQSLTFSLAEMSDKFKHEAIINHALCKTKNGFDLRTGPPLSPDFRASMFAPEEKPVTPLFEASKRSNFPWDYRTKDFSVASKTPPPSPYSKSLSSGVPFQSSSLEGGSLVGRRSDKMIVADPSFHVSYSPTKPTLVDRQGPLLKNSPVKKGISGKYSVKDSALSVIF